MALTPGRWLAIFAVGASAIVAAVIGVRASQADRYLDYYFGDYGSAGGEARAKGLASAVVMLERRDSLATAWRRSAARTDFEVVIGARVPAMYRHELDSVAHAVWSEQVRGPVRVRTVLMIVADSTTYYRGIRVQHGQSYVLVPGQTDGRTCAMILPLQLSLVSKAMQPYARAQTLRGTLERSAGPCVWFAKYGVPGRAFGGWLMEHNYLPAFSALERPPSYESRPMKSRTAAGTLALWYNAPLGLSAAACLVGRSNQCEAAWTTRGQGRRNGWLPRGVVPMYGWGDNGPTGVVSTHFVARLEAELGPEKFASLWTSDASLDSAFTGITGASLTEKTRRMLLADYGKLLATPWPTALEWALDLGLIVLGLGALVLMTRRRAASA